MGHNIGISNVNTLQFTILQPLVELHWWTHRCPFSGWGPQAGSHMLLLVMSLSLFQSEPIPQSFMNLTLVRSEDWPVSLRMSLHLCLFGIFPNKSGCALWQESHRSNERPQGRSQEHRMPLWVPFQVVVTLIIWLSGVTFLGYKRLFFSVIKKYLVGRYFSTMSVF